MSFGEMGGVMQPQGQAQILVRMIDYHQKSQAASDAPRWCVLSDMEVAFEKGANEEVMKDLEKRGYKITIRDSSVFGGAQLIHKTNQGYCGASDYRKDGQAAGFRHYKFYPVMVNKTVRCYSYIGTRRRFINPRRINGFSDGL